MATQRRKLSVEHKLQILQEADQQGITKTLHKHNLLHRVFLRCKNQFNSGGATSLRPHDNKAELAVARGQSERLMDGFEQL